ncbi:tRNA lysidine(34) synthetase TilS C-terminal domain-containing protein [Phaeobacter italicus]|uniref:tRNA lysidine(34) synthetase TilS C-terminal domain-containing protein n=1 Tax=Phaeobacter italicus TaxID=481446 RepID=UPI003CD0C894
MDSSAACIPPACVALRASSTSSSSSTARFWRASAAAWKVPPWQRPFTPILCCQGMIVAVGSRLSSTEPLPGYVPFHIDWQR